MANLFIINSTFLVLEEESAGKFGPLQYNGGGFSTHMRRFHIAHIDTATDDAEDTRPTFHFRQSVSCLILACWADALPPRLPPQGSAAEQLTPCGKSWASGIVRRLFLWTLTLRSETQQSQ